MAKTNIADGEAQRLERFGSARGIGYLRGELLRTCQPGRLGVKTAFGDARRSKAKPRAHDKMSEMSEMWGGLYQSDRPERRWVEDDPRPSRAKAGESKAERIAVIIGCIWIAVVWAGVRLSFLDSVP